MSSNALEENIIESKDRNFSDDSIQDKIPIKEHEQNDEEYQNGDFDQNEEEQNDNYNEDNKDEDLDFDENETQYNDDKFIGESQIDGNETVIDSTSDDVDLGIDDTEQQVDLSFSFLNTTVNTYNAFMIDSPATIFPNGMITVSLPTYFLPLSLQSVYGFSENKNILDIEIRLKNSEWTKMPTHIKIEHPKYKSNYVGQSLIKSTVTNFFCEAYKPRNYYRSETYLLYATGKADPQKKEALISDGFDDKSAERALVVCSNDLSKARDFLCTGDMPPHDSILSIDYQSCPLLYLILEFADCFLDLQDHCCICRAKMEPGLKPSVCSNEFCNFRLNQIGLGCNVLQEIQRDTLAADLMVSIFSAAADTQYLNPAPPESLTQIMFFLEKLPSMETMKTCQNDAELATNIGADSFNILRWILLSNRSQLISLPDRFKLPQFSSTFQFMTLISTPEAENKFRTLKNDYGSMFLWHGSHGERWHSIIRNGLKNATGTKYQANGAALGPGIYLARSSGTSWGYSQIALNKYKNSILGKNLHIIGLCEVAKMMDPNKKKTKNFYGGDEVSSAYPLTDFGWAHTLTLEEACVVRFLFVEKDGDHREKMFRNSCFDVDVVSDPPKNVPTIRDLLNYLSGHQ